MFPLYNTLICWGNSTLTVAMLRALREHDGMCKDDLPSPKYKRTFVFHDRHGLIQLYSKKDARADERRSLSDVLGSVWTNRVRRTKDDRHSW